MRAAVAVLALIVILSFFLAPWVAITPTDFLPDGIQQVLTIADAGLRKLAPAPVPGLLTFLETATVLPPFRMLLTGFLNPWMWIVMLLPFLVAVVTLTMLLSGWALASDTLTRWSAWVAACGGGVAVTLMLVGLPAIEHLGLGGVYLARLGLALAGIHLVWGYWLSLAAILGLSVACMLLVARKDGAYTRRLSSTSSRALPTYRRE